MTVFSSRYAYEGTEATDLTVVRVGALPDPTGTVQSRRIITTGNSDWLRPFKAEPYTVWNGITGSDVTVTVFCVTNTEAATYNDDIWMEIEYLGSAANTIGTIVNTTKANLLDARAVLPSEASGWGATNSQLNPLTKTAQLTLSNGNLTGTINASGTNVGVTGVSQRTAGKYYYEVLCGPNGGLNAAIGYMPVTSNYAASSSGNAAGASIVLTAGDMLSNNANPLINIGTFAPGDICSVAIDLTARLVWFRRNAGNWNNNATYTPTTGVGGLAVMPTVAFVPLLLFGSFGTVGDTRTINFGATPFTYGAPTGYDGWATDKTTFKLVKTLSAPPPGQAGFIDVRVRVAKPNAVYYIDPIPQVSPAGATPGAITSNVASRYTFEGSETNDTSYTRAGAAINTLGQVIGRKLLTTANTHALRPYRATPLAKWNTIVGTVTVTVNGASYGGAAPTANDIWAEVEYLGSGTSPLGSITRANLQLTTAATAAAPTNFNWGSGATPVSFDGANTANIFLSNNNCTVTRTSTVSNIGAVSTTFVSTGKQYLEMQIIGSTTTGNTSGVISNDRSGLWNQTEGQAFLTGFNIALSDITICVGGTIPSGSSIGTSAGSGDYVCGAYDLDAKKFWARKNNGPWNAKVEMGWNPGAGIGGYTMSSGSAVSWAPYQRFQLSTSSDDTVAFNFGAQPFAFDVPNGFGGMSYAWTPFKLATTVSVGQAGYVHVRVRVAKPNATVYIDPQIEFT